MEMHDICMFGTLKQYQMKECYLSHAGMHVPSKSSAHDKLLFSEEASMQGIILYSCKRFDTETCIVIR